MVLGAYCNKCTHQSTVDRLTVLKEAQYKQHSELQSIHLNVKALCVADKVMTFDSVTKTKSIGSLYLLYVIFQVCKQYLVKAPFISYRRIKFYLY